jgi:outer membrane murein-binding lipoprotein Lpp
MIAEDVIFSTKIDTISTNIKEMNSQQEDFTYRIADMESIMQEG